jgi:hypothetical protein
VNSPLRNPVGASLDLDDPAWFLEELDLRTGMARFVRAGRQALAAQPFLDQNWNRSGLATAEIAWSELPPPRARPRLGLIWHTSFCCSTLIASLLDAPGRCLALKEPRALVDLADLQRLGDLAREPELAARVLGLLARRFAPPEAVVVKPSNGANALMLTAAAEADGPVLLLHSPCADFVVSVAKAGEPLRAYVRTLMLTLLASQPYGARFSLPDLVRLTDLQVAALAWQLQMADLNRTAQTLGRRCRSLVSTAFLASPEAALNALDGFFGLGLGPDAVAERVNGPAFTRNAKSGRGVFDGDARAEAARTAIAALGADLDRLVEWSFRACGWAAPDASLPQPLLG